MDIEEEIPGRHERPELARVLDDCAGLVPDRTGTARTAGRPDAAHPARVGGAAKMRERVRVPDGVLIRMQLLLQIRCGLKKPMPDPSDQTTWLRCPNRDLGGRRPIEAMAESSHGMALVRDVVAGWTR